MVFSYGKFWNKHQQLTGLILTSFCVNFTSEFSNLKAYASLQYIMTETNFDSLIRQYHQLSKSIMVLMMIWMRWDCICDREGVPQKHLYTGILKLLHNQLMGLGGWLGSFILNQKNLRFEPLWIKKILLGASPQNGSYNVWIRI